MTPRQTLLAVLAAAGLAAGAALAARLQRPAGASRPLAGLEPADVARISVESAGGGFVLERAAGLWRLAAPIQDEADPAAAESLCASLLGLALGSEVSRDPEGFADYELDEARAVRVRVYSRASAAPVLDGWFGKPALGGSVYFRPSGEASVRLAEGAESHALRRGAEELRRRAVLSLGIGDLESLRFAGPRGFTLAKSSGGWSAAGRRLSADEAAGTVLAAAALRFLDFAAGGADCARPELDLTASGAGRSERILIGRARAGRRCARAESRGAAGSIAASEADLLLKALEARP
jgi:hypothetical protein